MKNKVKNIVFASCEWNYSYNSTINSIAHAIASEEELDSLHLWTPVEELPQLMEKAKELYEKYREEYYLSR